MFSFPTGTFAALQTDEKYHGKGYGGLVLRCLSKMVAKMGHDVYAGIAEGNTPSRSLFGKHGFKCLRKYHLICTKT